MRQHTFRLQGTGVLVVLPLLLGMVAGFPPTGAAQSIEGSLEAVDQQGRPLGHCPLKNTDVAVDIAGMIARVTVTQNFENPFEEPVEAVYTFPLSERAAVDSMTMTVGDRTITGLIKRREEARRLYNAARNAGQAASLLDQERPNIFTQSVANIVPGHPISITISYVEYLPYEAGEYTFSFPMVVGPRYIPGQPTASPQEDRGTVLTPGLRPWPSATDQVTDAGRITPPVTPKGTRAGHDISLAVRIDAGVPIQALESILHEIEQERPSETVAHVRLKNKHTIPNRDFVLKYTVAGELISDAVLVHADGRGGYFTLIMQPPARVATEYITPKEMIFVIDCSGSMSGFPIEKAKRTMRLAIEQMNPHDTFNLVSFAGGVGYCFDKPMPNTAENRGKALHYLENLRGSGGTEMMKAIRAALENQNDPERLRIVCFMTDGFIGNDMAILDAIQRNAHKARVFSFGIGNGVNRFLIEGMARAGRGAAEIVTLESDGDEATERFQQRIQSPLLTDITIDFGNLTVADIYPDPTAIPDLFTAQPLVLKGRYAGHGDGVITVRGNTATGPFERKVSVAFPASEPDHDVLATLWARARIEWLMEQDWLGIQQGRPDPDIKETITQLGLDYNLVTQFTSFVAVEERVITEGGKPRTVLVPVEMTDGVSYEGVFGEADAAGGCFSAVKSLVGCQKAQAVAPLTLRDRVRNSRVAPLEERESGSVVEWNEPAEAPQDAARRVGHAKLDQALWGLADKTANGNYVQGPVKVKNGWVEVFILLSDDSTERIEELEKMGVHIKAHSRAGKRLHARVRVKDLEKLVDLAFVKRIEPPQF